MWQLDLKKKLIIFLLEGSSISSSIDYQIINEFPICVVFLKLKK